MAELDALALTAELADEAMRAGASEAEATLHVVERFSTEARATAITKLEQSVSNSVALRVFVEGRKATMSSTDLGSTALRDFARRAVESARFVARDEWAGLPEAASLPPFDATALEMYADDVRAREPEKKLDDVRALEAQSRGFDARIVNSSGSRLSDVIATVTLANSRGVRGTYRASSAARSASPIADDHGMKRPGHYGSASRSYATLESVDSIARLAAQRALVLCGARKPDTMRVPVIFERDVAGSVLSDIFTALSGANIVIGNSYFVGRLGDRIGSDLVTIIDDGRLPRGLGTSPFDAEGTATRETVVFDRGVLRSYLFDTYYARRFGTQSTGNAAGGGIGANNFYLKPGTQSLEALIAGTKRGVFVLDTIGFATEYASGTYSRGARGMMIENGELTYPIEEFTIAGDLREMLAAVDGIANDLVYDGTIVSPSFRVAEMTISGN